MCKWLNRNSCIVMPGDHRPNGIVTIAEMMKLTVPFTPSEYFIELGFASYFEVGAWLYNRESFSCGGPDGLGDYDVLARDRVRHLRRILGCDIETGSKAYRLNPEKGKPVFSRRLLKLKGIDQRILAKLEAIAS